MGANKVKVTGFRIEDETILQKLNIIAKNNCRTRNKEVEYALKQYVECYENQNGKIILEQKEEKDIKIGNRSKVIIGDNSGTINM